MTDLADEDDTSELLVARWAPDADGTGELHVRVASGGFAGAAKAWFDAEELKRFAVELSAYPLPEKPLTIWGGFGANARTGDPAQEHVKFTVEPIGGNGQVRVHMRLASQRWPNDGPTVAHHEAEIDLLTTYERLRRFSGHLRMVVEGRLGEAILGTELLV
jgi:hypothetical protein